MALGTLITVTSGAVFAYYVYLVIYRLYFSPLAKFPGPKLAAISQWYEGYYEIIKKGRFTFKIDEMHKEYGPVVRVAPDEIHINDPEFWDVLFTKHAKASKYRFYSNRLGNDQSLFTTVPSGLHRVRRGALNAMFSRRAMLNFEPVVKDKVDMLCEGLEQCRAAGTVCKISDGYAAYSGDVIQEYSFGFSYDHLKSPGFEENMHDLFMSLGSFSHTGTQFPWLKPVIDTLPEPVLKRIMDAPFRKFMVLQKDLRARLTRIRGEVEKGVAMPDNPTIFHSALASDLPPAEKETERLANEAQLVYGAGVMTTAWALSVATFYILSNPEIHATLVEELRNAIPNPSLDKAFDFQKLEKLPYLSACIREAVRIIPGVSARTHRVVHEPVVFKGWTIPPEVAVSVTITDVHHNESIYPNPKTFVPSRWMSDVPKNADDQLLETNFVAFGKGPRSCLGINLAYIELYIAMAAVFRRFTLELYDTNDSDIDTVHDFMVPVPRLDSKGIRVKVLEAH